MMEHFLYIGTLSWIKHLIGNDVVLGLFMNIDCAKLGQASNKINNVKLMVPSLE